MVRCVAVEYGRAERGRLGLLGYATEWLGPSWFGWAGVFRFGLSRRVETRSGMARQAWSGFASHGESLYCKAWNGRHGAHWLRRASQVWVWQAGSVWERQGKSWLGTARQARSVMVRSVTVGQGQAGEASYGEHGQVKERLGFAVSAWLGLAVGVRNVEVSSVEARFSTAGEACHGNVRIGKALYLPLNSVIYGRI